jgi:hypothetical protein
MPAAFEPKPVETGPPAPEGFVDYGDPSWPPEIGEAYANIRAQLGRDPRDPSITSADLDRVAVPAGREAPYGEILRQLRVEAGLRETAGAYFQGLLDFVQNLHGSFQNRMEVVTRYLELQNSDVVSLAVTRLISEGLESIGEIEGPQAKLVSEVLKVAWDTYRAASSAASANKVSQSAIDAVLVLDEEFNGAVTAVETMKLRAFSSFPELEDYGSRKWPPVTADMRRVAGEAYEIALWKELLPSKWKVFCNARPAHFMHDIDALQSQLDANPNLYFDVRPADGGWYVQDYWLGSGSDVFQHTHADAKLVAEILSLGVTREELFMRWGLPKEDLFIPLLPVF